LSGFLAVWLVFHTTLAGRAAGKRMQPIDHGSNYQLAFLTPGMQPWSASFRKQMRQMPNFR
jgi:hypothetical protein